MIDHTQLLNDYLAAAIWTATDDNGENLDHFATFQFSDKSRERANNDLKRFVSEAGPLLEAAIACDNYTIDMIGHDYSLTRNGHGVGFWDRGLGSIGDRLSKIAAKHGEVSVYVTDEDEDVIAFD